jgi:hypothetical protein
VACSTLTVTPSTRTCSHTHHQGCEAVLRVARERLGLARLRLGVGGVGGRCRRRRLLHVRARRLRRRMLLRLLRGGLCHELLAPGGGGSLLALGARGARGGLARRLECLGVRRLSSASGCRTSGCSKLRPQPAQRRERRSAIGKSTDPPIHPFRRRFLYFFRRAWIGGLVVFLFAKLQPPPADNLKA